MLPTLCKYFSIDDNFINSLEESKLWFSDPMTFNDPYDCNLNVFLERDFELIQNHLTDINEHFRQIGHRYLEKEALRERVEMLFNNPEVLKDFSVAAIKARVAAYGVCCFAKNESKLLMWSHYAAKHHGVCLKFDMNKDKGFFYTPYEVQYPSQYPIYNYFRKSGGILEGKVTGIAQHLFATKSQDWKYEEEVRVVKDRMDGPFRGLININKQALIEVIFGYKTSESDMNRVVNALSENDYNVSFYKMQLLENQFGLAKLSLSR